MVIKPQHNQSFHSLRSLSVSFHVIFGLPSTCMSQAVLTAQLEHSTCPYQGSLLSFWIRSKSSMSICTSSSLDLIQWWQCLAVWYCSSVCPFIPLQTLEVLLCQWPSFTGMEHCTSTQELYMQPRVLKERWLEEGTGSSSLNFFLAVFICVVVESSWGWSDGVKVSCIWRHPGIQLILAYSWARPAILVAGKIRKGMFLFLLFLPFHSCSFFFPVPLFHLFYCLFSPFLWEMTQNDSQGLTCR